MPSTRSSARQNLSSPSPEDDRLTNTILTLNVLYQTHIHPLLPESLQPLSKTISSMLLSSTPYLSHLTALFRKVLASASNLNTDSQDGSALLSLGVLLITLYLSLRILNYIRRTIFGWIWLGAKLLLFLLVVQIGFYINSYGWERALRDAGWLGGIGWGILEDILNDSQGGQRRQPRGTRQRGQNNYNQYTHPRAGRSGRYG